MLALAPLPAWGGQAFIYVTNSAGDSIHVIDPATNKVVQEIKGIEAAHGIAPSPDGARVYVSNEADSTSRPTARRYGSPASPTTRYMFIRSTTSSQSERLRFRPSSSPDTARSRRCRIG